MCLTEIPAAQTVPELFSGSIQDDAEVGRGQLEQFANLVGLQLIEFPQGKDLGRPWREPIHAAGQRLPKLAPFDQPVRLFRPGLHRGGFRFPMAVVKKGIFSCEARLIGLLDRLPAGPAEIVDHFMFHDADHPSALRCRSAFPVGALQGGQEGFLRQILGGIFISHADERKPVERVSMRVDEGLGVSYDPICHAAGPAPPVPVESSFRAEAAGLSAVYRGGARFLTRGVLQRQYRGRLGAGASGDVATCCGSDGDEKGRCTAPSAGGLAWG